MDDVLRVDAEKLEYLLDVALERQILESNAVAPLAADHLERQYGHRQRHHPLLLAIVAAVAVHEATH